MRKHLLVLFIVLGTLFSMRVFCQEMEDNGFLEVRGRTVSSAFQPLTDAKITVYKNGVKQKDYSPNGKGKFTLELEYNYNYTIKFYSAGHIPMFMEVDGHLAKKLMPLWATFAIDVPFYENTNTRINPFAFSKAFTKVAYDAKKKAFADDEEYLKAFSLELHDLDKANEIRLAELNKKKAEEKAKKDAEEKAKRDAEEKERLEKERLLAQQKQHEQEQEKQNETAQNEPVKKNQTLPGDDLLPEKKEREDDKLTYENDFQKVTREKYEKEKKAERNKKIKTTFENDLLRSVAEESRRMREEEYAKANGGIEALEKIERMKSEFSLIQASKDINNNGRNALMKQAKMMTIKVTEMNQLIRTAAEIEKEGKVVQLKKHQVTNNYGVNFRPKVMHSVAKNSYKTIHTTTLKYPDKKVIYQKEVYIWGSAYFYKNGVSITETEYVNDLKKLL